MKTTQGDHDGHRYVADCNCRDRLLASTVTTETEDIDALNAELAGENLEHVKHCEESFHCVVSRIKIQHLPLPALTYHKPIFQKPSPEVKHMVMLS